MQYILSVDEYNELVNKVANLENTVAMQEGSLQQLNEVKRDLEGTIRAKAYELHKAAKAYKDLSNANSEKESTLASLRIPLHILKNTSSVLKDAKAVDAINTMCRLLDVYPVNMNDTYVNPTSKAAYDAIAALKTKLNEFGEIER